MKNEHIVQFLQAFPFNPSCNQLLQTLDEYCQAKTTSVEQNYDLKDNPSNKQNHLSKLFALLDLRQCRQRSLSRMKFSRFWINTKTL